MAARKAHRPWFEQMLLVAFSRRMCCSRVASVRQKARSSFESVVSPTSRPGMWRRFSALAQKKRFPGLLSMFARLGEQTGQLPLMLQRAAAQLSTEVQRRAMALATLLEPLLIVAMGGMVMLIVLAVLLPIIQLNQWVK